MKDFTKFRIIRFEYPFPTEELTVRIWDKMDETETKWAIQLTMKGDRMIKAGKKFLSLMEERGAVLLDTEIVLGHPELGYTGQPDKVWLMFNKQKTGFGIVITDWKTNKEKNMEVNDYTKPMKKPFEKLPNNALGHYNTQLPFYGKLLLKKMIMSL